MGKSEIVGKEIARLKAVGNFNSGVGRQHSLIFLSDFNLSPKNYKPRLLFIKFNTTPALAYTATKLNHNYFFE
jgi:hypothetical protein